MLLIDFFEVTPINSLLPVKSLGAERVAFLIDKRDLDGAEAVHLREAVLGLGVTEEFQYVPIDSGDVKAMKEAVHRTISDAHEGERIFVDLTGGTDLMVASGYSAAMETEAVPIHIDIMKRRLFRVDTGEDIGGVKDISLNDYMKAIGAKRLAGSHLDPLDEEEDRICAMAEVLFERSGEWHALADMIGRAFGAGGGERGTRFSISDRVSYSNRRNFDPKGLMKEFVRYGFVRYLGDEAHDPENGDGTRDYRYEVTDPRYREYMSVFGIWLEMYVYFKAKPYFDEAYLGMVVDWNNDDRVDNVDNEIDVALMKGSVPHFISCKMRRIEAADIYEIGFITKKLGGDFGRSYIATTVPFSKRSRGAKNLVVKMDRMNVGMILATEPADFEKLSNAGGGTK